jgi:hypothetical protein
MSADEVTASVASTIEHAIRMHEKIQTLQEALVDALRVAGSLAGEGGCGMDYATYYELARRLQELDVPGRSHFTGGRHLAPPPGTIIRMERANRPQWPAACPCVYLLMANGAVIYVGKTGHMASRITAHASKPWTHAEVIVCESDEAAAALEGDLIFQHQPDLNRAGRWERPRTSTIAESCVRHDDRPTPPDVKVFRDEWANWLFDGAPAPLPGDGDLEKSIHGWVFGGRLNLAELIDLIPIALDRDGVNLEDRWRYFCGVAWRHIKEGR